MTVLRIKEECFLISKSPLTFSHKDVLRHPNFMHEIIDIWLHLFETACTDNFVNCLVLEVLSEKFCYFHHVTAQILEWKDYTWIMNTYIHTYIWCIKGCAFFWNCWSYGKARDKRIEHRTNTNYPKIKGFRDRVYGTSSQTTLRMLIVCKTLRPATITVLFQEVNLTLSPINISTCYFTIFSEGGKGVISNFKTL